MAKCTSCGKSGLLLKTNVEGMCPECQLEELSSLRAALTQEQREIRTLQEQIRQLNSLSQELDNNINCKKEQLDSLDLEIKNKKVEMVETDEAILLQSFGFYKPQYDFINSETYKDRLDIIRKKQKEMITAKTATTGFTNWTVDGSSSKGKTMVNNMQKLLLRAFNGECDETINKVKYSNYDASVKRIQSSKDAISKLGSMMGITITSKYFNLKIEELTLAFEYQMMKQKEKEEQRELKAQMREEAKLLKEIEAERKQIEKEQNHYINALEKITKQLADYPDNQELLTLKSEI